MCTNFGISVRHNKSKTYLLIPHKFRKKDLIFMHTTVSRHPINRINHFFRLSLLVIQLPAKW